MTDYTPAPTDKPGLDAEQIREALGVFGRNALLVASFALDEAFSPGDKPDADLAAAEQVFIDSVLATIVPAVEQVIAAQRDSIEALIERSSLGTEEAKAVRESVPREVGSAIATAARCLARAEAAEAARDAAVAERDALRERVRALADDLECKRPGREHPTPSLHRIACPSCHHDRIRAALVDTEPGRGW